MIKSISIKNIALIENLEIDFKEGLNIITGETGAGKSILLGAISLILGSKGGVDIIRSGSDRASVEIEFDISKSKQLKSLLIESGIDAQDDTLIIKRELISDGRNNCFINLNRINVSNLKDFGELLVDITSQHQHQSLLKVSNHLYLLDNYSELDNKREVFSKTYKQYKELTSKLNNLIEQKDEQQKRLEYNKFVINEIEEAKLYVNEDVELEQQLLYLSNFQKLKDNLFEACNFSYHNENAVIPSLHKIMDFLNKAGTVDSKLENSANIVQEVLYKMEEVFDFIKNKYDDLEFSQDTLDNVINRLELVKSFKKRYGNSIQEIFSFKEKCEKEALEITFNQQQIEDVNLQLSELENILRSEAISLSTQRSPIMRKTIREIDRIRTVILRNE